MADDANELNTIELATELTIVWAAAERRAAKGASVLHTDAGW
jgi:hypothetical protein